jgi:hypothetical protein
MAINFNGGTDSIRWNNTNTVDHNVGAVSLWFRTTQATTNTHLLSHWTTSSRQGWGLILNNAANKISAVAFDNTATARVNLASTTSINDGNPHNVVFNFNRNNGGANQLYVDGALEASGNSTSGWNLSLIGQLLEAGAFSGGFWAPYVGDMWEIGYWRDIALTAGEVNALAKCFAPKMNRPTSLMFYAPLVRATRPAGGSWPVSSVTGTTVVPHGRVIGGSI